MDPIHPQCSDYQQLTASFPQEDCALASPALCFDTTLQMHRQQPAAAFEQQDIPQLHHQQQFSPHPELSPRNGESLIRMAFVVGTEEQAQEPTSEGTARRQIQAESACLQAVQAPPVLQQQISEQARDVATTPQFQAATSRVQDQQNLVGGSAVFPDPPKAPGTLPATGSFTEHIGRAMLAAGERGLNTQDLYEYFINKFTGLDPKDQKWKNSIRYRLSTSACFKKSAKKVAGSKGGTWFIREKCLDNFRKGIFQSPDPAKKKPTSLTEEEQEAMLNRLQPKSFIAKYADMLRHYTNVVPITSQQVAAELVHKYGVKAIYGSCNM
ncbi:hypothetical protein CAPTEDRAFT_208677 [Capitella teleta]|uniref:Fork-head domain-containing protein n=1 Tax=Capitella teleta TaxID=283909 RepID=R7TNH3_CAPTE|nr:hypothetical protein CAPTEDRAFT_208677 [Capitella teleta]|eukprot:ELT95403.1 hypothetical protein CAPTEDRAFT_208677 [Capitella teleta]